jgi:hypothetical protein
MSLLVNVTRPPTATVASNGMIPNGVIDTLAELEGGAGAGSGDGDGDVCSAGAGSAEGAGALDEPQPERVTTTASRHDPRTRMVRGSYRT